MRRVICLIRERTTNALREHRLCVGWKATTSWSTMHRRQNGATRIERHTCASEHAFFLCSFSDLLFVDRSLDRSLDAVASHGVLLFCFDCLSPRLGSAVAVPRQVRRMLEIDEVNQNRIVLSQLPYATPVMPDALHVDSFCSLFFSLTRSLAWTSGAMSSSITGRLKRPGRLVAFVVFILRRNDGNVHS